MSYSKCRDSLTPQQFKRARCYLNTLLSSWIGTWDQIPVKPDPIGSIPVPLPVRSPSPTPTPIVPAVPPQWTCDPQYYNNNDGW
jgi:hypothetical protein